MLYLLNHVQAVLVTFFIITLTHIIKAVRLSSLGTQVRHGGPFPIPAWVTFDQIIRRLAAHDPVTEELPDSTRMNDAIPITCHEKSFGRLVNSLQHTHTLLNNFALLHYRLWHAVWLDYFLMSIMYYTRAFHPCLYT